MTVTLAQITIVLQSFYTEQALEPVDEASASRWRVSRRWQDDDFDAEAAYDEMIRQERETQHKRQQLQDDDDDDVIDAAPLVDQSPDR